MNPWVSKINPWYAQPLTDASKDAKLRAVLSIAAERVIYGRQAIIVSWVVFAVALALLCVSIVGWILILPLKTIQGVVQNRRFLGNTDASERPGFEAGFRSAGCRVREAGRPPQITLAGVEARRGPTTSTSADGFRRSIIPAGCVRFAPRVDCV